MVVSAVIVGKMGSIASFNYNQGILISSEIAGNENVPSSRIFGVENP